jgi:hypothetical protein
MDNMEEEIIPITEREAPPSPTLEELLVVKNDEEIDKEAIRVIESMPMWPPGKQNRKHVSVYYTVPVRFVVK